jgi:hypothetical protein
MRLCYIALFPVSFPSYALFVLLNISCEFTLCRKMNSSQSSSQLGRCIKSGEPWLGLLYLRRNESFWSHSYIQNMLNVNNT